MPEYIYDYPRPMASADCILLRESENGKELLLIKRGKEPFKDYWAFPGGFIEMEERLVESAARELEEETGIGGIELTQFRAYGDPGRDPRGRVICTVFYGLCGPDVSAKAGDDASDAAWFLIEELPQMAFDHKQIFDDFSRDILA